MTISQHPTLALPPIEIEVVGYRLVDAFETAALKAITTFCEHHLKSANTPVVPAEPAAEEEDPKEIEGVSEIDSEHAPAEPNPQPDDSSSGSASSVGNLDNF